MNQSCPSFVPAESVICLLCRVPVEVYQLFLHLHTSHGILENLTLVFQFIGKHMVENFEHVKDNAGTNVQAPPHVENETKTEIDEEEVNKEENDGREKIGCREEKKRRKVLKKKEQRKIKIAADKIQSWWKKSKRERKEDADRRRKEEEEVEQKEQEILEEEEMRKRHCDDAPTSEDLNNFQKSLQDAI